MKNLCVLHILLFMLFMLVYQCAASQDYIITTRGDSLSGEVKTQFYSNDKSVQLTADNNKTTFSLFEIREFSLDGEIFHPVKGESGYVFMKLIKPGYLSLYAYQQDDQMRFDGLFLKKLDGNQMVVPNLGFKKYITRFLEDCPKVSDKIEKGELGKRDLENIVDEYNACISNRTIDHQEIIEQRQEQSLKISAWDTLEKSVREKDFKGKTDALDMITEIKKKIQRKEIIPNFLLEGLKNSLHETGLTAELDLAIKEVN